MRSSVFPLFMSFVMVNSFSVDTLASSIAWMDDLKQAVAESTRLQKPMLVKISTEWCGYCKKMDRETFSNERVAQHINHCFVAVRVDGGKERDFVRRAGVKAYPTTLVLTPEMAILKRITGFRTAAQLTKDLRPLCSLRDVVASRVSAPPNTLKTSIFGQSCPVSPLVDGRFLDGKTRFPAQVGSYRVYFHSEKHRRMFRENPSRYWPVADGKCVVSLLDEKTWHDGNLGLGFVYADRVWLFSNEDAKHKFERTPERYRQAYLEGFESRSQIR